MAARLTLTGRLVEILVPTVPQVVGSLVISVALLFLAQTRTMLARMGLPADTLHATGNQFHSRLDALLSSPFVAQAALVTFWAVVGLVAYLVCWGVYNVLVEARNEVTLNTEYTNRGHWKGPYETLGLKTISVVILGIVLLNFWRGLSLWIALTGRFAGSPSLGTALYAVVAIVGFAVQLYVVLVLIQLTFTPWYRPEAFTQT